MPEVEKKSNFEQRMGSGGCTARFIVFLGFPFFPSSLFLWFLISPHLFLLSMITLPVYLNPVFP